MVKLPCGLYELPQYGLNSSQPCVILAVCFPAWFKDVYFIPIIVNDAAIVRPLTKCHLLAMYKPLCAIVSYEIQNGLVFCVL